MLDELDEVPQEDDAETPEGSPDPALLVAEGPGRFEHHPLFPRADGSPETRDIKFVSFCRKRTGDGAMQNCPEDIPARDVKSWAQVVEWWGGGEYKAIAKDGKHRIVAWLPSTGGDWLSFDGESKPFVLRNGKSYSTPGVAVAPPSANTASAAPTPATPAPATQDALLGMMTQVLQELRNARVARPPPAADGALVAMIQAQATQATATSQANAQIMQTLLSVVAQRPAESTARPAEPTTLALQLIGAVQKLVPAPAAAPGLAEQIPVIKALRDLYQPAAVAPASELQPFVDIFGQVMAADAARTQAERAQSASKPQEPPPARPPPPRPRPALVHVPGVGMVEVVAPDAGALRLGEMSVEERAAAVRKDPALLRELGIGLHPSAVAPVALAQPAPAPPASPVSPVVELVAAVAAVPAVPDLEPTPVPAVATTSPVPSAAVSATTPVVASSPPVVATALTEPATVAVASLEPPAPSAAPSAVTASPGETAGAPEDHAVIALPERMPIAESLHAAEPDRERAVSELKRLTTLSHVERVAALRKLPGIGAMAEDVARAMASLPVDAVMAMAQTLDLDSIGALAGTANGIAGG